MSKEIEGVPASPSGHEASPSAAVPASSQSRVPNAVNPADVADYLYDPDSWECTYGLEDLNLLEEEIDLDWSGQVRRLSCLKKMPDLYACNIPDALTEDGDPDGCTLRYFWTEDFAKAAYASAMSARSDETPQEAQSEGRQRDPKGDAQ